MPQGTIGKEVRGLHHRCTWNVLCTLSLLMSGEYEFKKWVYKYICASNIEFYHDVRFIGHTFWSWMTSTDYSLLLLLLLLLVIISYYQLCWAHYYVITNLSVCPSGGGNFLPCRFCPSISRKRLKLGSCNFHHTVAPSLCFLRDKFHSEILRGSP